MSRPVSVSEQIIYEQEQIRAPRRSNLLQKVVIQLFLCMAAWFIYNYQNNASLAGYFSGTVNYCLLGVLGGLLLLTAIDTITNSYRERRLRQEAQARADRFIEMRPIKSQDLSGAPVASLSETLATPQSDPGSLIYQCASTVDLWRLAQSSHTHLHACKAYLRSRDSLEHRRQIGHQLGIDPRRVQLVDLFVAAGLTSKFHTHLSEAGAVPPRIRSTCSVEWLCRQPINLSHREDRHSSPLVVGETYETCNAHPMLGYLGIATPLPRTTYIKLFCTSTDEEERTSLHVEIAILTRQNTDAHGIPTGGVTHMYQVQMGHISHVDPNLLANLLEGQEVVSPLDPTGQTRLQLRRVEAAHVAALPEEDEGAEPAELLPAAAPADPAAPLLGDRVIAMARYGALDN